MILITGGAATEDSADPELIVSFGAWLLRPLPAQACIFLLENHPHLVYRVQKDPIAERASASEVSDGPSDKVA
jgi:hypothetical protein